MAISEWGAVADLPVSPEDRATAIVWVIQYIDHFQIVCYLYDAGLARALG